MIRSHRAPEPHRLSESSRRHSNAKIGGRLCRSNRAHRRYLLQLTWCRWHRNNRFYRHRRLVLNSKVEASVVAVYSRFIRVSVRPGACERGSPRINRSDEIISPCRPVEDSVDMPRCSPRTIAYVIRASRIRFVRTLDPAIGSQIQCEFSAHVHRVCDICHHITGEERRRGRGDVPY